MTGGGRKPSASAPAVPLQIQQPTSETLARTFTHLARPVASGRVTVIFTPLHSDHVDEGDPSHAPGRHARFKFTTTTTTANILYVQHEEFDRARRMLGVPTVPADLTWRQEWRIFKVAAFSRRRPSLRRLSNFADWWPLGVRRDLKAMVGDYDAAIRDLHKRHRYGAARWNMVLAWLAALAILRRAPFAAAVDWVTGVFKRQ